MIKKISLVTIFFILNSLVFAQVPVIHNPNILPTITTDQITAAGQSSQDNPAGAIVLDFEGLGDMDNISQFYNGGSSSLGFFGTNFGIYFSSNTLSLIDFDNGGTGNFANEPSPNTAMFFLSGSSPVMNVPAGFTTGFSFNYTSFSAGSVFVFDGLDGTGTLLASQPFSANYNLNCTGDPTGDFCHWDAVGVSFAGIAKSVLFAGVQNQCGFDNVTFGSTTPGGNAIPTFTEWGLIILGLALLGLGTVHILKGKTIPA